MVVVATTSLAQNPATTVNVNANANRHLISPLIYGANWADQSMITSLNLSVNRRGVLPLDAPIDQACAGSQPAFQ